MIERQPNTAPLCGIFDVPEVHRDNAPEPRQRTPGLAWWDASRRVFTQFAWLQADSVKVALSRPTHQYPEGA